MDSEFVVYSEFPKFEKVIYDDNNQVDEEKSTPNQFYGDAYGYCVELDGLLMADFGDDYHDKGRDKAIGFVIGYLCAGGMSFDEAVEYAEYNMEHSDRVAEEKYGLH